MDRPRSWTYAPVAGSLMAFLALSVWYCTICKEISNTIDSFETVKAITASDSGKTHMVKSVRGEFKLEGLSPSRALMYDLVCVVRIAVAAVMTWQGTLFLVYVRQRWRASIPVM